MGLSRPTLLRVFLRSFFIQATWNYERMQNLGFAYAMAPALEALYPEGEALRRARSRHLALFNTHPYLAVLSLGVCVRLEEQLVAGQVPEELVHSFKVGTMGGLGAIGDAFFWGTLKPLSLVLGLIAARLGGPLLGVVVCLGVYNLVHLGAKGAAFVTGYGQGLDAMASLQRLNPTRLTRLTRQLTLVLLGVYAALLLPGWPDQAVSFELLLQLGLLGFTGVAYLALSRRVSMLTMLYLVTAFAVLLSSLCT